MSIEQLITEHLDIWTAADTEKKSGRGRSSGSTGSVYGIKKLRELILELAVRGKLVPQDASDEPASELLKRIAAEKAKLVAEGKIKKSKSLAEITDDEKPFELLVGWELVKLGTLCYKLTDGSHNPPKDAGTGFPMLSSQNVNFGKIDFNSPSRYVSADDFEVENARTKIESGDVLLTIVASLGRPAVVPNNAPKFVLQRSVAVIKTDLMSEFLCLHLASPLCLRYFDIHAKGTAQKGIYLGQLSEMPIVVPPIKEQHCIVAKVDELMALCDQLENQHNNAAETHEKLVTHLLGTLTQSQNAEDFNTHWQRISEHFDTLFTTESSIDALKQTLLQLAVMGKLVPQDPNDEPASELLKRIQAEKAQLIAEGKIKKDKPLAEITDEEKPFDLPVGWVWARLQSVIDVRDGTHDSPKEAIGANTFPLVTSKDFADGDINFDLAKRISEVDHIEISKRSLVEKYDILFSMIGGNIGNQVIVLDDRSFSIKNVALFKYYNRTLTFPFFIKKYTENLAVTLQAPAIGGAQPFVALGALRNLVIALPPIEEQHYIVTKIDEFMTLCDQLKSSISEGNQLQKKLADVMIEQAIS